MTASWDDIPHSGLVIQTQGAPPRRVAVEPPIPEFSYIWTVPLTAPFDPVEVLNDVLTEAVRVLGPKALVTYTHLRDGVLTCRARVLIADLLDHA